MKIDWYPVERQALPAVLMGVEKPLGTTLPNPLATSTRDAVLGLIRMPETDGSNIPAIVLVGSARREVFSWISSYAEEVFPLSQFGRVLSTDDWLDIAFEAPALQVVGAVNPIWPSLVVGEMLGQVSADLDVASMALSRASACFSFAMARTALLYPARENLRTKCAERLSLAEREARFGRRNITTELLKPIWSAAFALEHASVKHSEFVSDVLGVLRVLNPKAATTIESNKGLLSDSAEERVKGFDMVTDSLFAGRPTDHMSRSSSALCFAAAALLAGRGTSHIQLLAPVSQDFPDVFVWFGLLAGVAGPRYWDKAWTHQAKGVERVLRQFFRPDEPVQADICWVEYDWLARTYDSIEVLTALPRNFPSGLTIELLPGVACQFRLGEQGGMSRSRVDKPHSIAEPKNSPNSKHTEEVVKVLEMLRQAQELLQKQIQESDKQSGLFSEQELPLPQKSKRRKENHSRKTG